MDDYESGTVETGEKDDVVTIILSEVSDPSQSKIFLDEFLDIVEKYLKNSKLNIKSICSKMSVSRATLNRKIKNITKETPKKFIQSYRLLRGKQFIEKNIGSIAEISEMVGFSDQFNFSKCFKKKFGKSPKIYQREYINGISDKKKEKLLEIPPQTVPKKTFSIQVDFTLDELDRAYISKIKATKSENMFEFKDKEGTPQRRIALQGYEDFYAAPISLASNHPLTNYTIRELQMKMNKEIDKLNKKVRDINPLLGYTNERFDLFEITDINLKRNAESTVAVCIKDDLLSIDSDYFELKVKNYKETFNLCFNEPFSSQPIAVGRLCSGVLVNEDVVLTSAQITNNNNIKDIRFIFNFALENSFYHAEKIPDENIYKGVKILRQNQNPKSGWVLVKLDRKVRNQNIAVLSMNNIKKGQPVYIFGHPCGLPLKYAPGISAKEVMSKYFSAKLDIYSSTTGSPVFCAQTHELIGIVSHAYTPDFRWSGSCWFTLRYPKPSISSKCSRIPEY